jgi:hypothetical protein
MTETVSIGMIVAYRLTQDQADQMNRRRVKRQYTEEAGWPMGAQAHVGNPGYAGAVLPLIVTAVWEHGLDQISVNGQVVLDGNDALWVTSAKPGDGPGSWSLLEHADLLPQPSSVRTEKERV